MIKVLNREDFLTCLWSQLPLKPNVAEIGVLHGDFSESILTILNPKRLFLVDPYSTESKKTYGKQLAGMSVSYSNEDDYSKLLGRFSKEIMSDQVVIIKRFSYDAIDLFRDESLDAIYIDASHLYEDAKRDLGDWLPKLKKDGLMCLHDYIIFDDFGVIQAVDEFCKEHNFEKIIFNWNGGDVALKKKQCTTA